MKLLTRYLIRRLGTATLYALLALVALFSFFEVINAVDDVGDGSYTVLTLLLYVGMRLFGHMYTLLPLAVLVGCLAALSQLASASEWTVIRTSGASLKRIIATVAAVGLLAGFIGVALGEWVAPYMEQRAERLRLHAVQQTVSLGGSGLWFRQGRDNINVREMLPDGRLRGIRIYRYNEHAALAAAWQAEEGRVNGNGTWTLKQVARTSLLAERTHTERLPETQWQSEVGLDLLGVLLVDTDQMSARSLKVYIDHLQSNGQQTATYATAWWRKLLYPLVCTVMALVALAFTPQSARHGNIGVRLFLGICLGLAFHFAGLLSGYVAQLSGLPPLGAAALPGAVFALAAAWLIRRQEVR
ncbi:LPS export ABC transporter permease LptG [Eikenella sp. Marseille-P7795]|uniref:LPS export ABC transporter permease LptG n=1 Tax=Eikenella sp. Marseille-P7795 TaxID=2866577 RepID=UPI001CE49E72|nr:LPS export ABC transporter permease LptG [Eikenella sp. Marseille-P7795]